MYNGFYMYVQWVFMIVVFYYIAYLCCSTRLTVVLNLQINQDQEEAVVQNDGVSHLHVALLKNLQSHAL